MSHPPRLGVYRRIAGPVSLRTGRFLAYPPDHSFASVNDWPTYGFTSPTLATEPECSAKRYSARFVTR